MTGSSTLDILFRQSATNAQSVDLADRVGLQISIMDFVPRTEWAAIQNGTSTWNAAGALQSAIDLADSRGGGVVELNGYRFRFDSGVTIDMTKVSIDGGGAIIDASNMTAGDLITVFCTNNNPGYRALRNSSHVIERVTFLGPGTAVTQVRGIVVNDSSPEFTLSNLTFAWLGFTEISTSIILAAGAFTITIFKCNFTQLNGLPASTPCISIPAASNSGERNDIIACQFNGHRIAINQSNGNASTFISHSSFDYCSRHIEISSGSIHCTNCYFEDNSDIESYVSVSGENTLVRFVNCELSISGDKTAHAPFYVSSECLTGGVALDSLRVNQVGTWTTRLIDGIGRGIANGTTFYFNGSRPAISAFSNLFAYGDFENANWPVEWEIDQPSNVTRITTDHHSGSASLQLAGAAGLVPSINRRTVARPGDNVSGELWVKTVGISGSSATAYGQISWVDAGNNVLGSNAFLIANTTAYPDWTRIAFWIPGSAPAGTAGCALFLSIFGTASGAPIFLLDDVMMHVG